MKDGFANTNTIGICSAKNLLAGGRCAMVNSIDGTNGSALWCKLVEVWDDGYFEGHGYGSAEKFGVFGEFDTIFEGLSLI